MDLENKDDILDLLNEIEATADDSAVVESSKKISSSRSRRAATKEISFTIFEDDKPFVANLLKIINNKKIINQNLIDFYTEKFANMNIENADVLGRRKAYNTIDALTDRRDIRISTLLDLCEFLKLDITVTNL